MRPQAFAQPAARKGENSLPTESNTPATLAQPLTAFTVGWRAGRLWQTEASRLLPQDRASRLELALYLVMVAALAACAGAILVLVAVLL